MSIELLNIDCMEYMKDIPDNYFDLAIVDPPYGIGENGSSNKNRGGLFQQIINHSLVVIKSRPIEIILSS